MISKLRRRPEASVDESVEEWATLCRGTVPVAEIEWRARAKVAGRVRSLRIQP